MPSRSRCQRNRLSALFLVACVLPACIYVPDGKYVVTGPELQEILAQPPEDRYGDVRVAEGVDLVTGDMSKMWSGGGVYELAVLPVILGATVGIGAVSGLVSQAVHFDGWAEIAPNTELTVGGSQIELRDLTPQAITNVPVLLADNYTLGERLRLDRQGISLGVAGGLTMIPIESLGVLLPAGHFRTDVSFYLIDQLAIITTFRIASGVVDGGRLHELYGGLGVRGWVLSTGRFHLGLEALAGIGATMHDDNPAAEEAAGLRLMAGPIVELELTTNLGITFGADALIELSPNVRFGGVLFELGLTTYFGGD